MTAAYNTLGDAERIAALSRGTVRKGRIVAGRDLTPVELELQRATLARDYNAMFTKNGVPYIWPRKAPLGKYSFVDDNGQRRYIPFTGDEIRRFGYSPYARIKPGYKCGDKRRNEIIKNKTRKAKRAARKWPSSDPRHIRAIYAGQRFCSPSQSKKMKKVAMAAALVAGAVFLGPAVIAKAATAAGKGALAVGKGALAVGGKIAGVAAKAMPMAVKALNSKAMVDAVAAGEMPPPPISLGDGSLTDYAQVVGQQILEREQGRAASAAELEQLRYMIEQERRRLAAVEQPHLPVVNTGLDPALTAAQKERADQAVGETSIWKSLAIAVPAGLFLMR